MPPVCFDGHNQLWRSWQWRRQEWGRRISNTLPAKTNTSTFSCETASKHEPTESSENAGFNAFQNEASIDLDR